MINDPKRGGRTRAIGLLLGLSVVALPWVSSKADVAGFACPKPGTTVTFRQPDTHVEWTHVYRNPDPNDPVVCIRVYSINTRSQDIALLYNFFTIHSRGVIVTSQGIIDSPELRAGLGSFFSGQSNPVTFKWRSYSNSGGGPYSYEDTLTRVGTESITLSGRTIQAWIVERREENKAQIMSGAIKFWYDPQEHIILKSRVTAGGTFFNSFYDYDVTSITGP